MRTAPLSARLPFRLLAGAVLLAGAWTLCANLMVAVGGGLDALLGLFGAVLAAVVVAAARSARRGGSPLAWLDDPPPEAEPSPAGGSTAGPWLRRVAAGLAAAGVVLAFALGQDPRLVAGWGLPLLAAGAVAWWRAPDRPSPLRPGGESLLLLLGLAAALVTLAAHHPDNDDCLYVNLAVTAASRPDAPLLAHDGIFGLPDAPVQLPVYRVHSIELAAAALTRLTGLPPILGLHWVLAALAAFLVPTAQALLLRRLLPGRWQAATLLALAFLLLLGDGKASFANYAFVRLHQGKGVMLTLLLPVVLAFALRYARRRDRGSWVLLFAAQAAAVGASSSGLVVVPAVAWVGLLAAWRGRWDRRLPAGLAASVHPLLLLLLLSGPQQAAMTAIGGAAGAADLARTPSQVLDQAAKMVLGQGRERLLVLFALLFAWSVPRHDRAAGRVLLALPAVFLLLSFNPVAVELLGRDPLRREIWFRGFWILPLPALVAVALCAGADLLPRRPRLGAVVGTGVGLWILLACHAASPFSQQNDTWWQWPPTVKAPPLEYQAARWLVEGTPEGAVVLAPAEVAAWVPTFLKRTYPLYARYDYERYLRRSLDADEVHKRRTLVGFVSREGEHLAHREVLCYNASIFDLQGICLRDHGEATREATAELGECGFAPVGWNGRYRVWTTGP